MSKLNDLIKEMCPKGVKKRKLQDIVKFENGKGHERVVNEYGKYILLTSKAISTNLRSYRRTDEQLSPLYKDDITMVMSDLPNGKALAKCFLVDQDNLYTLNQRLCRLTLNDQNILPKYLYYLLNRNCQLLQYDNGVDQTNLRKNDILKIELLIPPIEIQEEIVKILDKFGELEAKLESELEAELEARKSQYEFWRDKLFTSDNLKQIEDICLNISSGGTPNTSHSEYYGGNIPWLRTQEVNWNFIIDTEIKITDEAIKYSSAKIIPANCVIVAMYGATVGRVAINSIPLSTNQACCNLEINPQLADYKYVFYWLSNQYKYIKSLGQGSQTNINAQIVKKIKIPLPSIEEQKRIIDILDKFDKLLNDITVGLPAEIELRRKQYEYYRNKLLNFEDIQYE